MNIEDIAYVDFETEGIERRPNYPPVPGGVAIQLPGERKSTYYAWNHHDKNGKPLDNNTTKEQVARRLRDIWRSKMPVAFMHGKFDMDVAEVHFGLPLLPWERYHDVEYLLFLFDPHAKELALKPSAERILGIPPEERNLLEDWIITNIPEARKKPSEWGAFIIQAPVKIAGPYANGDNFRTKKLLKRLLPEILKRNMGPGYDRERRIMPIFLKNERVGIRADLERMEKDYVTYLAARERAANWLRKTLKAPDLNLDADKDVGEVLNREGIVTEWTWTKGGHGRAPQRSVSKKTMTLDKFHNAKVALTFGYYNRLGTCLSMFFEPWIRMASEARGYVHPTTNQTRQDRNGGNVGTRTGRPSCDNPNFYNVPKNFEDKDDGYKHPVFHKNLPPLPLMRQYLLPDKGQTWIHRDFNQQELRMTAHFEDGGLAAKYCAEPRYREDGEFCFDIHSEVQSAIKEIAGLMVSRGGTKIVNFADLYGRGITTLAEALHVSRKEAEAIRAAKNAFMPGVSTLTALVKARGGQGFPIRTWGGREYFVEPPRYVEKYKRVMDFAYKLLNYLVQGSCADVTKEAIIRYDAHPKRRARFLVTVYDELNASSPVPRKDMPVLREVMEGIECDVPLLSDGKHGPNWGALQKVKRDVTGKETL